MREKKKENKGITLIALIITIIVMLILVATTINVVINGPIFEKAREATFKTELSKLQEELAMYKWEKKIESFEFDESSLSANKQWLYYDPVQYVEDGTIEDVMPSISESMKEKVEILNGEIMFTGSEKEIDWAKDLGINKMIRIENGVLLSDNDNLSILSEDGTFTVPSTVTTIGEGAFAQVEGIKKVIIPYTVKEIAKNAFYNNPSIELIEIQTKGNQGLEKIGVNAFYNCTNLREVILPETVKDVGQSAFENCTNLSNVVLSGNVTGLNALVFSNCTSLTSIDIPEGVSKLDSNLFSGCVNLYAVKIPSTVTSMSTTTFSGCIKLKNLDISEENKSYAITDGVLMNATKTTLIFILDGSGLIENNTFTVPDGITSLSGNLLSNYSNVTKIIIPESVRNIDTAFFSSAISEIEISSNNKNYKVEDKVIYSKDGEELVYYFKDETGTISIREGVTKIGSGGFSTKKANNVTDITFPNSLTTLAENSIRCTKVTSLYIGENVDMISPGAFGWNTIYVKNLTISGDNENYSFADGILYDKNKTKVVKLLDKSQANELELPGTVKIIGDLAFYYVQTMKKINIPDGVEEIGERAFYACIGLKTLSIPSSVEKIGVNCFQKCENLTNVQINKTKGSIQGEPWGLPIGSRGINWN